MPEIASFPDLFRLVVLPFFGYLAWRDIKTRRVPHRTWYPLVVLAVVLLVWETYATLTGDVTEYQRRLFLIQVAFSLLFVIPLSYGFWLMGGFGAADAKAFMVIAVLLPTYPEYDLSALGLGGSMEVLPLVGTDVGVGVFSLTILSNTVLVGALYPVALAVKNAVTGYLSPGMFVATPIPSEDATGRYGTMLEFSDDRLRDVRSLSGLNAQFSWRSLDLDALRMYLQWRGLSLKQLQENPDRYRDPESLPEDRNPPGDGSIPDSSIEPTASDGGVSDPDDRETAPDDPWGATEFLEEIDHGAYGTTPEILREGLDKLADDDVVWISPGIPFIVPMFFGLVIGFTYGDVLFSLLGLVGMT